MIETHTGLILGFDKHFATIIKNKISGKQVMSEDFRCASFFPELNLAKLEKDGPQETLFNLEHLFEEESAAVANSTVTVSIKRTKMYEGNKIICLCITETATFMNILGRSINNFQQNCKRQSIQLSIKSIR